MKTYSKSRIELRTLEILKKMLGKSSHFSPQSLPCSQGLRPLEWSKRGETLKHAGHVSTRIWEMTINLLKERVG